MKKTSNIKTRIIAGLLSTITAFSVGAIAISSASAAETNSSEYILQQNNANEPMSYATVKAEDYGKQAGVNAANAALTPRLIRSDRFSPERAFWYRRSKPCSMRTSKATIRSQR